MATRYGLEGRGGSNPGLGRDFPRPSRPALEPIQPLGQWLPGYSREYSHRFAALITQPHLSAEIKEEYSYTSTVSLCLYSILYGELYL